MIYAPLTRGWWSKLDSKLFSLSAVVSSVGERDIALENRRESYFEANERDIYERYVLD